jgi:hypothetical protein
VAAVTSLHDAHPISVEIATRWEAVSLLRLLDRFRPWTVQLAPDRWMVVGRLDSMASAETAEQLLARWAAESGRAEVAVAIGDDVRHIPADGRTADGARA